MSVNTDCSVAPLPEHGVVEFDPEAFKAAYPQFASVADPLLTSYFDLATMIVNNTCRSPVSDAKKRERLLNLLVAHIATLFMPAASGGSGGVVGRVSSATEGSVSIDAEYASEVSKSMAWFIQTPWGALFWQLTLPYRSFRYFAPDRCCGPAGAFAGRRY